MKTNSRFHRVIAFTLAAGLAAAFAFSARAEQAAGSQAETPRTVLDLPSTAENPRNSEGAFLPLSDGRILFAYSKFLGSASDHGRSVIAARESRDGGETWSAADRILAVHERDPQKGNVMSVSLLRLDAGRIALFYLRKDRTDRGIVTRIMMRTSSDEGATWSAARDCSEGLPAEYRIVNNARVLRLKEGRILIPLARHKTTGKGDWDLEGAGTIFCLRSDDAGATWRLSNGVDGRTAAGRRARLQEPGLVERSDGELLMFARSDTGRQWEMVSRDRGATWGEAKEGPLFSPLSPATMLRLGDGRIVCAWNDHEGRDWLRKMGPAWACGVRTPLVLGVSADGARTWPKRKILEGKLDLADPMAHWYCYVAMLELPDRLLLAYSAESELNAMKVVSVPKAWLPGK